MRNDIAHPRRQHLVNVHVNNLLAIFESDFDNSGEPGVLPFTCTYLEYVREIDQAQSQRGNVHTLTNTSCNKLASFLQRCDSCATCSELPVPAAQPMHSSPLMHALAHQGRFALTRRRPVTASVCACRKAARVPHGGSVDAAVPCQKMDTREIPR